ncbi:hypothetical protein AMTR_s00027p00247950 [Amborella trichopoda]|uniref:Pectinesterase n=2 Tax=Amborella trichopoda TaxID=13333 RepID=W1PLH3_AMBTC|nr:hypothetical protein AMTR_s00027p00247950 [Amborella trichopoda]
MCHGESRNGLGVEEAYLKWVRNMGSLTHSIFSTAMKNKPKPSMYITVDKEPGSGDFVSVQEAIDSLPDGNGVRVVICIHEGVYREKVNIAATKAYISLEGAGAEKTVIEWDDTADKIGANGQPMGTFASATMAVNSPYFIAKNITFKNTAPVTKSAKGKQAVALRVSADTAAFFNCKFKGAQDTLYDHIGRHYFEGCYIEGSVDFIFGNGLSLYKGCHVHAIDRVGYGALTAQKRENMLQETGFSFVGCRVTGSGAFYLGRAWGTFSRVVFAYTFMDNIIARRGWYDWGDPSREM